jgi:TolB-like protein
MLGRATFLASVALAVLPAQVLAGKLPKVAVLDVKPIDDGSKQAAEILQEVILTDLSKARRFEVVGRSDIAALIGFEKQKASWVDKSEVVRVGRGGAIIHHVRP